MELSECNNWEIDSHHSCEKQYSSIKLLLNELVKIEGSLEFHPIDDIPADLGVELFEGEHKIAEIYCAENKEENIGGMYSVFCKTNWAKSNIVSIEQARSLVSECLI